MEILVILFCIVALVVVDYFIAKEFYFAAEKKGYANKKYLWFCFFFSFIGYLLVIALPDCSTSNAESKNESIGRAETTFGTKVNGFSSGAMDIPKRKRPAEEE